LFRAFHIEHSFNASASRYISKNGREIAEDATQIFGGRALTVTGMGKLVENVSSRTFNLSLFPSVPLAIVPGTDNWAP